MVKVNLLLLKAKILGCFKNCVYVNKIITLNFDPNS